MANDARRRRELQLPERDRMPRWVPRAIGLMMAAVVGLATAAWLLEKLQTLLVVLLVSMFLSFAMEPAVNWLARRGWRRGFGTAAVFLVFVLAVAGFTAAMASVLADQITTLIDAAPGYLSQIENWADEQFGIQINTDELAAEFTEGGSAASLLGDVAGNLVSVGSALVNVAVQLLTIVLFTFYLVADGPRLRRLLCSALDPVRQAMVLRGWELAIDKTGGYIYSRTLLAVAAFLLHWGAFAIIGVPFPAPLAMWVGVLSQFVPVVGTYLAGLLPLLIALLDDPITALWVAIVVLAYQQIENYLLAPRVTAHTMNIHPAVAFGSVLAGAALLGSVGALLAVPAAATIQAFVSTYIKRHELIESELFETHDDEPDESDEADEPTGANGPETADGAGNTAGNAGASTGSDSPAAG
ncbi:AI-2E family transporter [Candidatus Poriferisodalis sp.]|uniref:AI-2E family transporter n=1 Tax=Candidatus Poriferisodalis sp. TaxID=3101277 RepID=UPI003AF96529